MDQTDIVSKTIEKILNRFGAIDTVLAQGLQLFS